MISPKVIFLRVTYNGTYVDNLPLWYVGLNGHGDNVSISRDDWMMNKIPGSNPGQKAVCLYTTHVRVTYYRQYRSYHCFHSEEELHRSLLPDPNYQLTLAMYNHGPWL